MLCQNCGSEISESMKFCGACGTKIIKLEKKICPSCKSEGPLSMKFCGICGYNFSAGENLTDKVNDATNTTKEINNDIANNSVVESEPSVNSVPVVEEVKSSEPLTAVEKMIIDKAENQFYSEDDIDVEALLEEIAPIYQAHPEDEIVVPLYFEALSKINFERAVEKLNNLRTNILRVSVLKIDLALQIGDLAAAERELNKAVKLWPNSTLVISHEILYAFAVYEKFNSKEWLDKAISTVSKLENSIANTKIERSWKEKVLSLVAEKQGSSARLITEDYCEQKDFYYSIAKTELSELKEDEEDFLAMFEGVYSPCNVNNLEDFLYYEEKFNESHIQNILTLYFMNISDYENSLKFANKSAEQNDPDGIAILGGHLLMAFGVNQDVDKAKELIEKSVAMGSAYGEMLTSLMYLNGVGYEVDPVKAFEFSLKAAEKGNVEAMACLGDCYNYGQGVEENKEKAFEWYEKSADQGDSSGQNSLACMYYEGVYVSTDYSKAFNLFTLAAEQGEVRAQFNLATMYEKGLGCKQDYKKACELYEQSANQGNVMAINSLGVAYYKGNGVNQDYDKAFELFQLAAEQGYEWAIFNLGESYLHGNGIEQNYEKAMELYEKAADMNVADAIIAIGDMYFNGIGVEQNYFTAYEKYKKAAELGHSDGINKVQDMENYISNYKAAEEGDKNAQYIIANIFYNGTGVKQDYKQAFEWYQKTINQGDLSALKTIGHMYEKGLGVEKNVDKARECYRRLVDNGNIESLFSIANTYELENSNYAKEAVELYKTAAEKGDVKGIKNFSSSKNVSYSNWEKLNILENFYKKFTDQNLKNEIETEIGTLERNGVNLPPGKHSQWEISGKVDFIQESKGFLQRNKFTGKLFIEKILNKSDYHSGDACIEVLMAKQPIMNGKLGEYKIIFKSYLGSARPNRYYGNVERKEDFQNQPDSQYPYRIVTIWESCDDGKIYLAGWYELPRK